MADVTPMQVAGFDGLCVAPRGVGQAVLVLLHGHAMEPEDLAPLAAAMGLPATLYLPRGVEAASPTGRAWWPVDAARRATQLAHGARDLHEEYPPGRGALRERFAGLADALARRHPGLPTVLAGFSQGGMLATDLVLHGVLRPSALALLSTSCVASAEWPSRAGSLRGLPVLVAHGRHDPDLAITAGQRLRDRLAEAGAIVSWLPFEGGHIIPLPVWRALRRVVARAGETVRQVTK
jgi:phospholipase/carboxylesterase